MITLEKLTEELRLNQIDEVIGGWTWTTEGDFIGVAQSSGSDDKYHINLGVISWDQTFSWT